MIGRKAMVSYLQKGVLVDVENVIKYLFEVSEKGT